MPILLKLIGLVSNLRFFWEQGKSLYALLLEYIKKQNQKKREENIDKATDEAKKPDKSIEETANAACKIEKHFNPNSDCDANHGQPKV